MPANDPVWREPKCPKCGRPWKKCGDPKRGGGFRTLTEARLVTVDGSLYVGGFSPSNSLEGAITEVCLCDYQPASQEVLEWFEERVMSKGSETVE
jgi:hypothetical protein